MEMQNPTADGATKKDSDSLQEMVLKGAIALSKSPETQSQATEQFNQLVAQATESNPELAPLMQTLWKEFIDAQRSAFFWKQISDAEKELSEKMSDHTIQLKRNYMRLMQEQ